MFDDVSYPWHLCFNLKERSKKERKRKLKEKKNSMCVEKEKQHTTVKLVNYVLLDGQKYKICFSLGG